MKTYLAISGVGFFFASMMDILNLSWIKTRIEQIWILILNY